jgi:hypothetical protein
MQQDNQLPPDPQVSLAAGPRHDSSSLPPFDSDMMEIEKKLGRKFNRGLFKGEWTTGQIIALIFIGSFIAGVLFTSSILAGVIEIHPSAIKAFIKSLLGKG